MTARNINEDVYFSDRLEQPPANPQYGASSQRVKRKRHRVPVACFNCRAHKTKCDGKKPVCSTCASNGDECQYSSKGISTSSTVVMVNQQYLNSIEERLARLEQITTHDSVGDHNSPNSDLTVLPQTPANRPVSLVHDDLGLKSPPARNYQHSVINTSFSTSSSPEDALFVSADPDVFMGGVSFTELILNAMNGRALRLRPQSFCSPHDAPLSHSAMYQLPDEAHDLVRRFFDVNHTISPIFHEPTILPSFAEAIKAPLSERPKHRTTLALLNMIFAVCLSHRHMERNENSTNSTKISRRYYDIAMALLTPSLFRDWHISKVQALLLGARYLQCSNSPDECWNVLGFAIRIAHGLELHRAPPVNDPCCVKEVKKRVWWACFTLDQLLSMIYGRPAAINTSSCPLPLDLDDECIFVDQVIYPSPKRASSMSFSIEVAKLYRILEAATRSSANFDTTEGGEALAQSVLVLDERVRSWYAQVPRELKLEPEQEKSEADEEKPLILALRTNMVRILIHRPSLSLSLRALSERDRGNGNVNDTGWQANEGVQSGILLHSRKICVSTAMETVGLIARRHEQTRRKSGTSWFNLYYLFNAILVLVSHVVHPAYHNDRACLAQLDTALAMIKAMSSNHQFAQKAYSFLQQLISCMEKSLPMTAARRLDGGSNEQRLGPGIGGGGFQNLGVREDGIDRLPAHGVVRVGAGPLDCGSTGVDEELFAGLFDFTQDLSETYANIESGMSAWVNEQDLAGMEWVEDLQCLMP